ncbi:hypothetical protein [Polyangium aurulentum]|uniref:hypothetical protein n=1 Tax=Polyangium aurulentum TaxID=2567896 RepID=UPI0010ADD4D8|nr:hypothetical protein [Polyangium aurulentum]UQA55327.1 hypothetical protein E8A73_028755 [Polyangium aurulentum]
MRQRRMSMIWLGAGLAAVMIAACGGSGGGEPAPASNSGASPLRWSQLFAAEGVQSGWHVAVDGTGHVVVVGTMEGTVDFGGEKVTAAADGDLFVARYDAAGKLVWVRHFGQSGGYQVPLGLAVSQGGDIAISGAVEGTIDFGGGALTSAGDADAFLVLLGPDGAHRFSTHAGDALVQSGGNVAMDAAGNVLWTGTFEGTLDLGGNALASAGESDIFVAKLDPTGAVVFAQRIGAAGIEGDGSIAADSEGNVIASGYYQGAPDLGGGPLPDTQQAEGQFLVKLDANGKHVHSRGAVAQDGFFSYTLEADGDGGVLLAGRLIGAVDLGGQTLEAPGGRGFGVARIDRSGAVVFAQAYGSTGPGATFAAAAPEGEVVVAGTFEGDVDLGGEKLTSAGGEDIFVARVDATGKIQQHTQLGGPGSERVWSVAVAPDGAMVLTGGFDGSIDLGGGPRASAGDEDAFVAVVRP